jgi:putative ABC transport system ATP-binding protein
MPDPRPSAVRLGGVSKSYGHGPMAITALREADLEIRPGELVAVIGPSGSGKSTLLAITGALLAPDAGTVQVGGINLVALPRQRRARFRAARVGFVFQSFNLVPFLTPRENLLLMALLAGQPRQPARRRADGLLDALGLGGHAASLPGRMSGGEQQRVAIARALMNDPAILLVDEPTASLDTLNGWAVVELLALQVREHGTAGLMVTHDARMAAMADRVMRLTDGELAQTTAAEMT